MKTMWMTLLLLSLAMVCGAADDKMGAPANKVEAPAACTQCGMDRTHFARSRMVITYGDGTSSATCSLHCAAADLKAAKGKRVVLIKVADYHSKRLVNARIAAWVMGGDVQGVMTPVAKWAFAQRADAEAFVKEHGGKLVTFDEALKAAKAELDEQPAHHDH